MESSSTENDFRESWDKVEEFYVDLLTYKGWDYVKPVQDLIKHLRALGYDKLLRAGQSIHILVLSRSRNWGLRDGQHRIGIQATSENIFKIWYVDGENTKNEFETQTLIEDKSLDVLLSQLLQQPID